MKKVVGFVVCVALLFSLGVSAFAEESEKADLESRITELEERLWICEAKEQIR